MCPVAKAVIARQSGASENRSVGESMGLVADE
jgi:hypothetical protein